MNDYEETHINLLVRLSREAHEPTITARRFTILANAISYILNTINHYHGIDCLRRVVYMSTLKLGYSVGPLNPKTASKLIDNGLIVTSNMNLV